MEACERAGGADVGLRGVNGDGAPDVDAEETREWLDSLESVLQNEGPERARFLAGSSALSFLRLRQGHPGKIPSPEEAAAYQYSDLERAFIADRQATQLIGAPDTVRSGLESLLKSTEADELMITTQTYDPADRSRSFDLVAEAIRAT